MRYGGLILALLLPLLVACKMLPQGADQPPSQATVQDTLDGNGQAAGAEQKAGAGVRPKLRPVSVGAEAGANVEPTPAAPAVVESAPLEPVVAKSKLQITCEKRGGNWGSAGKSKLKSCIKRTRDAGKQCRKQGDCESVCLARSNTCAPIKPLFGCNEILQKDGSRVTLCID